MEKLFPGIDYDDRNEEDEYEDEEEDTVQHAWTGLQAFRARVQYPLLCRTCQRSCTNTAAASTTSSSPAVRSLEEEWKRDIALNARLLRDKVAIYDSSETYWPKNLAPASAESLVGNDYDLVFVGYGKRGDELQRLQRAGKFGTTSVRGEEGNQMISLAFEFPPDLWKTGVDVEAFLTNEDSAVSRFSLDEEGRTEEWDDQFGQWFCIWNGGTARFRRVVSAEAVCFPWIPNDWETASSDYSRFCANRPQGTPLWLERLDSESIGLVQEYWRAPRPSREFRVLPDDLWVTFSGDDTCNNYNGLLIARKSAG